MSSTTPHRAPFDLFSFSLAEMSACQSVLRKMGDGAGSMEEVAERIVRFFYEGFRDPKTGGNSFALVRFFKTHRYGDLDGELQEFVRPQLKLVDVPDELKCLTLLATAGDDQAWNTRSRSANHKAIPLANEEVIERIPMIQNLITQLGVEANTLVKPDPRLIANLSQKTYNVFYVPDAEGSPYIPAQDEFVIPHGIKSVLGFGGVLPSGDLFAVILFTKVHVSKQISELFQSIALAVKLAILSLEGAVFR